MYRYETHMHTAPVSRCANSTVEESLLFYKDSGYDGVFITNHFIDGNLNIDPDRSYTEKINFYFSDYEAALEFGRKIGLKIFLGIEMSLEGTDFLVYGIDKAWLLDHPEIQDMKKSQELPYLREHGAFIIQAHPFREAMYIDHIRLFPRCVDGVEIINANRTEFENEMAKLYAESYGLLVSAGSDNHFGSKELKQAGIETEEPICSVNDFIFAIKSGKAKIFTSGF